MFAVAVATASCGSRGVTHVVQPGETLYRIGQAYGVPHTELARVNHLRDPDRIYPGQKLFIPGARRPVRSSAGRRLAARPPAKQPTTPPKDREAPRFDWPLARGTLTAGFGPRGDAFHDGIDVTAPMGAPVRAAADGEVVYAGHLPGYGNLVILRHRGGYVTVYAHNERNYVKRGQRVQRGQLIAALGRSGRTSGPNLHFEIRHRNVAVDPLRYLPPNRRISRQSPGGAVRDG